MVNKKPLPSKLEVALIPRFQHMDCQQQFPGIYLFTNHARLSRPVKHLVLNREEWISPLEQLYLSIAVNEQDIRDDSQYQEYQAQNMLVISIKVSPFWRATCLYWPTTSPPETCISVKWRNRPWELLSTTSLTVSTTRLTASRTLNSR